MKGRSKGGADVPEAMRVQISRLFGEHAALAKATHLSDAEWRRALSRVAREFERYVEANVDTDPTHRLMLQTAFWAVAEAVKTENFFPAYIEAITRLALLLMGDYPDHRRRRGSGTGTDHCSLQSCRTGTFARTPLQRLNTLVAAHSFGVNGCTKDPWEARREFRDEAGFKPGYAAFLRWFAARYPVEYAASFLATGVAGVPDVHACRAGNRVRCGVGAE